MEKDAVTITNRGKISAEARMRTTAFHTCSPEFGHRADTLLVPVLDRRSREVILSKSCIKGVEEKIDVGLVEGGLHVIGSP